MNRLSAAGLILRRIALLAMLLPFLALSALPAGVMPGRGDGGTLVLVLCTPQGAVEMAVDLDHAPAPDQRGCDWAIAQAATVLPEAIALARPSLTLAILTPPATATHLHSAPVPGLLNARAPPLPA